jgi:hypothetical protein
MLVSADLDSQTMAGTIAHEGGYLRFPYLGHGDQTTRFDDPEMMCSRKFPGLDQPNLETHSCDCP